MSTEFRVREDRFNSFMSDFICGAVDLYSGNRMLHTLPFRLPAILVLECSETGLRKQLRYEIERIMRHVAQSYMAMTRGLTA